MLQKCDGHSFSSLMNIVSFVGTELGIMLETSTVTKGDHLRILMGLFPPPPPGSEELLIFSQFWS